MNKDKRPVKASSWEGLAVRESGSLMGGVMLSKSLIQFSFDGHGCFPSLLFDLRPNCLLTKLLNYSVQFSPSIMSDFATP